MVVPHHCSERCPVMTHTKTEASMTRHDSDLTFPFGNAAQSRYTPPLDNRRVAQLVEAPP